MSIITQTLENIANMASKVLFANVLFFTENLNLPFLIFFVILGCVFFTIKLKFINFRYFIESFRIFFEKEKEDKSGKTITSRSAFLAAISGCVGVGSIYGVAAAVFYGGPGVVFWLLIAAFLAMPLRFAEVYLGHHFRKKDKDGNIVSYGPFAYIKYGLSEMGMPKTGKVFAVIFAVCLLMTSIAAMLGQAGPTAELISSEFFGKSKVAAITIGVILAASTLAVIFGGLSRISKVVEKMATVMSIVYLASILYILVINFKAIPAAVSLIIDSAFQVKSIYGGTLGILIVAFVRIISMNEIGLGTVSILHGKSKNENSAREAMLSMSGPVVAILVFVALNSFAVIVTGSHNSGYNGVLMISHMFSNVSSLLSVALTVVIALFGITTLIAWYFYVDTALKELKGGKILAKFYPIFFCFLVISASVTPFGVILKFIDVIGIAVIVPNVIVLCILSGAVSKGLSAYKRK